MRVMVIIVLLLALAGFADAQWEYGGKQIGYGPVGFQPRLAPDGSGGFFVAWEGRRPSRTTFDIILNRVDSAGVLLFGLNGLSITDDTLNQSEVHIASDGQGGCYLIWADPRDYNNSGSSLYAQRVTGDGQLLWGDGVRMIYTPGWVLGGGAKVQIYADSSIGLIGAAVFDPGNYEYKILAQKIDIDGSLMWDSIGATLFTSPDPPAGHFLTHPKICKSNNWLYCALMDGAPGAHNYDIFIQKFDSSGNIYFGVSGLPVSIDDNTAGNWEEENSVAVLPDGVGGVVVGWIYIDLSLGNTIMADRFSAAGNSLWQADGRMLLPMERSERFALGFHALGDTIVAVVLGGFQANYQLVDFSGNLLLGDNGGVFTQESFYASSADGDRLYFAQRIGNYFFGSKRDIAGNEYWPNVPYIHGWLINQQIMPDGFGGIFAAFTFYRDFPTDWLYVQRIYPDGHFGGDTTTVADDQAPMLPDNSFQLTNYPNPFNGETVIQFSLSQDSDLDFEIYNLLGQQIERRVLGRQKMGINSYRLDLDHFSSGIYFIRITTDEGHSKAIAITLLK
jgi:hypothetical protein